MASREIMEYQHFGPFVVVSVTLITETKRFFAYRFLNERLY